MARSIVALAAALAATATAINNGKGMTPPMGWRSWNLYGGNVNQQLIMSQMAAITNRTLTVNGVPTSFADLGYKDVGLDDNWQLCGSYGPNKYTYHDANGFPVVNTGRFPDFIAMTTYAHSLNLTAGFYSNNCICSDHCSDPTCYMGDVDAVVAFGFDSIKLDNCGQETNLTLWADLFQSANKSIMIENCHWGLTLPTPTWCPFNYYRSSSDIRANFLSVVTNLQTVIPLANQNLSTPGCWAYPDMGEWGVNTDNGGLTLTETRTHFNAWCIVSSPLIMSHDMTNMTLNALIWPIVANTEAIAVNQAYYGNSGTSFYQCASTVEIEGTSITSCQYFYKPISATQTAILLVNYALTTQTLSVNFTTIPGLPCTSCNVRDLNAHTDLGVFNGQWSTTLDYHDAAFLMLSSS